MGHFSNGTEGDMYQEKYCERCIHNAASGCPVWTMHLIHNDNKAMAPTLNSFIPLNKDGLYNEMCVMFTEVLSGGKSLNERLDKKVSEIEDILEEMKSELEVL